MKITFKNLMIKLQHAFETLKESQFSIQIKPAETLLLV
jgi:hypothetical protein